MSAAVRAKYTISLGSRTGQSYSAAMTSLVTSSTRSRIGIST